MQDLSAISTRELTKQHVLPTYGRFDLVIERGEGCRVWDDTGRCLLDFGAGIAVCSLGHAHPAVTRALSQQAARLVHTSNLYYTRPQAELAARLNEVVGIPGKVFLCNSGAEANEGLYKLTRRFGVVTGRYEIITFHNSFHGRTLAGVSATAQEKVKVGFAPLLEGFRHATFNDLDSVREQLTERTAAILIEPVQGEGGIHIARHEFLHGLAKLCEEHDLLLLFDEVQCGLGRTGDWGGWQSLTGTSITPDGLSWAKGIANGVPLGAFWVRDRLLKDGRQLSELLGPGSHGTTYGGNPLASAAALAVLETIERENLLANVLELGAFLRSELEAMNHPAIASVRAIGLMIGIELDPSHPGLDQAATPALSFVNQLAKAGLLVIPAGERVIRLLPPLNLSREDAEEALALIRGALQTLGK